MKKLTAGVFTVMLGLVALDANAAITSQKYVDDAIKAASDNLTEYVSTTINESINESISEDGDIAKKIADAVKVEENRATAREDAIAETIGDTTKLKTEDKDSIVGAINSLKGVTDELLDGAGLGEGSVKTINIENNAVTTEKLADVVESGSGVKIEYNSKGQVIKSGELTEDDIPELSADKIANLNKLATATIPDTCGNAGSYCVLRFDGTNYAWEDVAETYTASVGGDTGE